MNRNGYWIIALAVFIIGAFTFLMSNAVAGSSYWRNAPEWVLPPCMLENEVPAIMAALSSSGAMENAVENLEGHGFAIGNLDDRVVNIYFAAYAIIAWEAYRAGLDPAEVFAPCSDG